MKILICDWCGHLDDPERGTGCLCRTPYDPAEVRARHAAAVEAARASDRLRVALAEAAAEAAAESVVPAA